jgi:DNA-directed RNA polymerase specialized sigma24 family protein
MAAADAAAQSCGEAAFFGGLTVTELAERFEIAPSTVQATLTAGLHALRDGLSESP